MDKTRLNEAVKAVPVAPAGECLIRSVFACLSESYDDIEIFYDEQEHNVEFDVAGVGSVVIWPNMDDAETVNVDDDTKELPPIRIEEDDL